LLSPALTSIAAITWCYADPYIKTDRPWALALATGLMVFSVYLPYQRSKLWSLVVALLLLAFSLHDSFPVETDLLWASAWYFGAGILYACYYPKPFGILPPALALHRIPVLKKLSIAIAWTLVTTLPAVGETNLVWVLHRLLFVLGLSIAIDLRDMEKDRRNGVTTIAQFIGFGRTATLSAVLVLGSGGIILLNNNMPQQALYAAYTSLLTACLLLMLKSDTKPQHYAPLIDGMMAISGLGMLAVTTI
jgi:4-hydroxybenzoate polyprenyltransferase